MPAASKTPPLVKVGPATHFSTTEGGRWYDWEPSKSPVSETGVVFAIKFQSGWIWDSLVGWRSP